ncbi:replication-relaxation family protein [Actinoplanes sp. NPDC049668]|uniref:replication-relaxation family protein n=1 Tax=unclassified Actinoplanes TaxID=2626549 RepID=UPI00339FCC18
MIEPSDVTRDIPAGDISRPGVPHTSRPAKARSSDTPRRSRPGDSLREISSRLEPRDYVLAHLLHEHRYLTTAQITAILFTSERTCRNRLNVLRKIGFIDWFMPVRPVRGRLPVHWVPGPLSARYVALHHGQRPPTAKAVREAQDALVAGGHLDHTDGANQFFVDLLAHARSHTGTRLMRWWPTRRIAAAVNHNVRPDGHGVWREDAHQVAFFLEYDTGSEAHAVLAGKLAAYRKVVAGGGPFWPVLFWLPTAARETNFHRRVNGSARGLIVATASRDTAAAHGPAGPVWKVAGNGRRRLRLAELPGRLGKPGPYHPGPATAEQDPLHLLSDGAA